MGSAKSELEQLQAELEYLRYRTNELEQIVSLQRNMEKSRIEQVDLSSCPRTILEKESESPLHSSRIVQHSFIHFLPDATFIINMEGKVMAWNRAIEVMTGIPAEEMLGKGNYEYAIPFYGERRPILIDLVLNPDPSMSGHYNQIEHKDGLVIGEAYMRQLRGEQEVYLWATAAPLYDVKGNLIGAIEAIRDITDRKRTEDALRRSEMRYRRLLESAPFPIAITRVEDDILLYINQKASDLVELPKEKANGLLISECFFNPHERRQLQQQVLQQGQVMDYEISLQSLSGKRYWTLVSASLTEFEGEKAIFAAFNDISERKRTEEALRRSEESYRLIAENVADIIWTADFNLKYTYISPAVTRVCNFSPEEVLAQSSEEILTPASQESALAVIAEAFEADKQNNSVATRKKIVELELYRKDGSIVQTENTFSFLRDENQQPIGILGVTRDITERKLSEEEKRKLEARIQRNQNLESLGVLAGGIAHDFNNALAAILNNLCFSEELVQDGEIKESLRDAIKACKNSIALTKQLLTFAKGGVPVKEIISLEGLLKDTTDFCLRGSNIRADFSINDPWLVEVDIGQIGQVIQNLVINAKQAMPSGGTIHVDTENIRDGDKYFVRIIISDSGTGIPQEYVNRIFDPYFTTKEMGSGLGLAIAYSIVHKHGGRIAVESTINHGTTFFVDIPAIHRHAEPEQPSPSNKSAPSARILIMDDEVLIKRVLVRILEKAGHQVVCTQIGDEAIKVYQNSIQDNNPFDVILLDLTIPGGMGGKETGEEILRLNPNAKIIVSSGYSDDPVMGNFRTYGFVAALAKPYSFSELLELLAQILTNTEPQPLAPNTPLTPAG